MFFVNLQVPMGTALLNVFIDELYESTSGLHSCLDSLQHYVCEWKLNVDLNKTQILFFL
jgi:hypothetical protein